ncbi:MAG: tetratricopeptide repeat protein [Gemmatimonadota bacterium]
MRTDTVSTNPAAMPSVPEPIRRTCPLAVGPLTQEEESPEGVAILLEVPGAPGALLWGALRDVLLWIEARRSGQGKLFAPDAARTRIEWIRSHPVPEDLVPPLLVLAEMTGEAGGVMRDAVTVACGRVATWAMENGAVELRLAFTEAAALLAPEDPHMALAAGRLARDVGRPARAETWLRKAVKLARNRDWETYVWAFTGLGLMYWRAGNLRGALAVAERALRTASRHRLRHLEGVVLHNLFMFVSDHDVARAYQHVWGALRAYGAGNPRLAVLAQDVACYWADHGQFARALPVIEAALPRMSDPHERMLVLAGRARAAAGAGLTDVYEEARVQTLRALSETHGEARAAETLVVLASADLLARKMDRAEEAARRGAETAARRGEHAARMAAEAVIEAARARRPHASSRAAPEPAGLARQADRLQGDLILSLAGEPAGGTHAL